LAVAERQKLRNEMAETPGQRKLRCGLLGCPPENDPFYCDKKPPNDPFCVSLAMAKVAQPYIEYFWELGKAISGLSELENCLNYDLWACAELTHDLTINNKLRVLKGAYETLRALKHPPCLNCFPAGTRVLMGDRSTKAVEDVRPGDTVLATNPAVGGTSPHRVSRLITDEGGKNFHELTVATGAGDAKLTATHEHPFWVPAEKRWVEARALTPGTRLLDAEGATVEVKANRPYAERAPTYNLTVEDLHTYYVLAGNTPVLVHNSNGCKTMVLGLENHANELTEALEGGYNFNGDQYKGSVGNVNGIPFTQWMSEVKYVLMNNGKTAVSLKGFDGDSYEDKFMRAYRAGISGNWRATEWEMGQIGLYVQRGSLDWRNVTFYDENGKAIPHADFPEPKW